MAGIYLLRKPLRDTSKLVMGGLSGIGCQLGGLSPQSNRR